MSESEGPFIILGENEFKRLKGIAFRMGRTDKFMGWHNQNMYDPDNSPEEKELYHTYNTGYNTGYTEHNIPYGYTEVKAKHERKRKNKKN